MKEGGCYSFKVTIDLLLGEIIKFHTAWTAKALKAGKYNIRILASSIDSDVDARYNVAQGAFEIKIVELTATMTFYQVGVGTGFTGTVLSIDGTMNLGVKDLPKTFTWSIGSSHTFAYYSPLDTGFGERYVWTSTSGLSSSQSGTVTVTAVGGSITGNFRALYQCTVTSFPVIGDGLVTVDGSDVTTPYTTPWWDYGSSHAIAASSTVTIVSGQSQLAYLSWSDSGAQSHSVSPSAVTTYIANFVIQYYFSVSSAYGSPTGQGWYDIGTAISSTVTRPVANGPGVQYETAGFSGTGSCPSSSASGESTTGSFPITEYSTVTWNWKTQYYLTVASPYGTPGGQDWYDSGSTAHAAIADGVVSGEDVRHVFTGWSGDASGTGLGSDDILMNAPKTATANWKAQYYIAVASAHGTPTASQWLDQGGNLTAGVTSPVDMGNGTRYRCTGYTLDGNPPITDGSTSCTLNHTQGAHVITFNWIAQYYLNVTSPFGDPQGGGWYDANSTATFSVTSPVGTLIQQVFMGWSGDSTTASTTGTVVMNGPKAVNANWRTDYTQLYAVIIIAAATVASILLIRRRRSSIPHPSPTNGKP